MKDKQKIYICGKLMEGDYMDNVAEFAIADRQLAAEGYEPQSPVPFCLPTFKECNRMKLGIFRLMDCDAIYMLKGWRQSRQARLEHFIALHLGLKIIKQK